MPIGLGAGCSLGVSYRTSQAKQLTGSPLKIPQAKTQASTPTFPKEETNTLVDEK